MPEVFGRIEDITLAGFLIRTVIVGFVGYLVGRNVYKRAVNQLTTYDFALIWILGAITVSPVLDGKVSFTYMFVPLLTLFFWHTAFSFIALKNRTFSFFFNGKPAILIDNGKVVVKNMKRQFISVDLLLSELRIHNVFDVSEVKYAILEPNAHISVMKFDAGSAVTPADMNLTVKPSNIPLIIINEGRFVRENLNKAGVDEGWVLNQLNMKHEGYQIRLSCYSGQFKKSISIKKRMKLSKSHPLQPLFSWKRCFRKRFFLEQLFKNRIHILYDES